MNSETTKTWRQYERGIDYLRSKNIYDQVDKNYRFYGGDHWHGAKLGDMPMPVLNVIMPVVNYKVAVVAQSGVVINFSPNNYDDPGFMRIAKKYCEKLNNHAARVWEYNKMDTEMWHATLTSAIAGDAVRYFYYDLDNDEVKVERIDGANIYFGDEQEPDMQEQPYIIIAFRRTVESIREEAKNNGVPHDKVLEIAADEETRERVGDAAKRELDKAEEDEGKCLCLLKLWKQDGTIWMEKSTRNVVYFKAADTRMKLYPVAFMVWDEVKGSARGNSEVASMINNQLEINKTAARRAVAVMQTAYPKIVYNKAKIANPDEIEKTGARIEVDDYNVTDIRQIIDYLRPAQISTDAKMLQDELITMTKELSGASEAALGQINPEQASGAAILAVRDAATVPMTLHAGRYKQFAEDIGRIWVDMWTAYSLEGKKVIVEVDAIDELGEPIFDAMGMPVKEEAAEVIPAEVLSRMLVNVKVDVSPLNPYSRYAVERTLENLYMKGAITFEEYIEALPNDASAPKATLKAIVDKRQMPGMMPAVQAGMPPGIEPGILPVMGGDISEMPGA